MELKEKLQALRKQKGLTQEELAAALFVSRTAVSKWESGRGTPNLDSLKAIAALFSVSLDQLLSDQLDLPDTAQKTDRGDLCFGLLDVSAAILPLLPCLRQQAGDGIRQVSLLQLEGPSTWLLVCYWCAVLATTVCGIATLALQSWDPTPWVRHKRKLSIALGAVTAVLFIISLQPYAAVFFCGLLGIKWFFARKSQ